MNKEEKMLAVRDVLKEIEEIISDGIDEMGEENASQVPAVYHVERALELYKKFGQIGDSE